MLTYLYIYGEGGAVVFMLFYAHSLRLWKPLGCGYRVGVSCTNGSQYKDLTRILARTCWSVCVCVCFPCLRLLVSVFLCVALEEISCGWDPIVGAAEAVAMVLASEGCCFTTEGGKWTLYGVTHPENSPLFGKASQYDSAVYVCKSVWVCIVV